MTTKQCCGTSVGVLLRDTEQRLLLIERATPPIGWAPVAGHALDEHPDPITAARAAVAEEVGLRAGRLRPVYHRWLPNRCRRIPAPPPPWAPTAPPGHDWQIYAALDWDGALAPSARETRAVRWLAPAQLQGLAERTVAYACGRIAEEDYTTSPGLEPVWVDILRDVGLIEVEARDAARATLLSAVPPVPQTRAEVTR